MNYIIVMSNTNKSIGVLFVCMGNICRSPTGEGVFRHYVNTAGYEKQIRIDSAGIIDYHAGDPADYRMREVASRRGYALDSIARQIKSSDFQEFDLIVPMEARRSSASARRRSSCGTTCLVRWKRCETNSRGLRFHW